MGLYELLCLYIAGLWAFTRTWHSPEPSHRLADIPAETARGIRIVYGNYVSMSHTRIFHSI